MSDKQKPLAKRKKNALLPITIHHWMLCIISLKPVSLTSLKWTDHSDRLKHLEKLVENLRAEPESWGREAQTHHCTFLTLPRERADPCDCKEKRLAHVPIRALRLSSFQIWAAHRLKESPDYTPKGSLCTVPLRFLRHWSMSWPATFNHVSQIAGWA